MKYSEQTNSQRQKEGSGSPRPERGWRVAANGAAPPWGQKTLCTYTHVHGFVNVVQAVALDT